MSERYIESKDLSGQTFGKLTVIEPVKLVVRWKCICVCGKPAYVTSSHLLSGATKSCGCFAKERNTELNTTHGQSYLPIYNLWANMLNRCNNPNAPNYYRYGGRGITICQHWHTFENWYEDIGQFRPSKKFSLDRSDNDGGYWCGHCDECMANSWPMNCTWETAKRQARNRTNGLFLTLNGETKNIYEWSDITGLSPSTISGRIRLGWPTEELLSTPRGQCRNLIAFKDRTLTISGWATLTGIPKATLAYRLGAGGWSVQEALETLPLPRSQTRSWRKSRKGT